MISVIVIIIVIIILLFGYVLLFGAPYLPTLIKQRKIALDILDLKAGQVLVELGSGDGSVLIEAAKREIKCIGYELNPILYFISYIRCLKYKKLIKIKLVNFWHIKLPECDAIYVFLLDKYMEKLDKKIIQEITKDTKVLSFAFKIPNKPIILEQDGLYLYNYVKNKSKS